MSRLESPAVCGETRPTFPVCGHRQGRDSSPSGPQKHRPAVYGETRPTFPSLRRMRKLPTAHSNLSLPVPIRAGEILSGV